MSEQPAVGGKAPIAVEVKAGEEYWWCACGRSKSQPFCDGSHEGTDFSPVRLIAAETKRVFFCACKRSATKPLCDGSHKAFAGSL